MQASRLPRAERPRRLTDDRHQARSRLGEYVYEQIQAMLLDGILEAGARISVDAISRQLGVSQTPVRESLTRLEAEDLVTKTHLIGYSATSKLTPARFEDLFEARLLIEPYAAQLAASRHQTPTIEHIAALTSNMRVRYEAGDLSYGAFAGHDAELHENIIGATGNSYLSGLFATLHCHFQLFRLLHDSRVTTDALGEHDRIVKSILERNATEARVAMHEHLIASRGRLRMAFISSTPGAESDSTSQTGRQSPPAPPTPPRSVESMTDGKRSSTRRTQEPTHPTHH